MSNDTQAELLKTLSGLGDFNDAVVRHIQGLLERNERRIKERRAEIATYEILKQTQTAEAWLGTKTEFKPLLWLKAETWEDFELFPTPAWPDSTSQLDGEAIKEYTVRCPGTNFYYSNKVLPVSHSLSIAVHRRQTGKMYFDGPIKTAVLFEQMGEEEDFVSKVWMGLTPMEVLTQKAGISLASGRCVIGGLGLGWFLKEVAAKPEVTEIVVVEKCKELLDWLKPVLMAKYPEVAKKVSAWVHEDVYKFMYHDVQKEITSNCKYLLDIWPIFGDADYDKMFFAFEAVLKERLWGWGRGATYGGTIPTIAANEKLDEKRAYIRSKPCTGCPFSRTGNPDEDGYADPLRLIGQAHGAFLLPCHQEPEYEESRQGAIHTKAQCAGAAIFRSNIGIADKLPEVFHKLPADKEAVYADSVELLATYGDISQEKAKEILTVQTPAMLLAKELQNDSVRILGCTQT